MARAGIAARLLVLGLFAAIAIAVIGGWVLRANLHDVVARSFAQRLDERADRIIARFRLDAADTIVHEDSRGSDDFGRIFSGWYWQLAGDGIALRSRSLWDAELAAPMPSSAVREVRTLGPNGEALLGIERPLRIGPHALNLQVLGPAADVDSELRRLDQLLGVTLIVLVITLTFATLLQVRLGLRPLARLRTAMAAIDDGSRERVGDGYGSDLDPLAQELDDVLERNARVIQRARHHAADLSHALKKPLALLAIDAAAEPAIRSDDVAAQVRTMTRLIERHLARAGSGAGERRHIDVAERITAMTELLSRLHAERGLRWSARTPDRLPWRGEPTDLEEMLGNLLDNAGKWANTTVDIHADVVDGTLVIHIDDDGPGLAADQIQRAADRGLRFDETVEGSGLGLAISGDIADTYGGRLHLDHREPHGLRATLQLPL